VKIKGSAIELEGIEVEALTAVLQDWIDDCYSVAIESGDADVIADRRETFETLRDLLHWTGVEAASVWAIRA
jgi:hypothetical protein